MQYSKEKLLKQLLETPKEFIKKHSNDYLN